MRKFSLLVLVVVFSGWSSGASAVPSNNPITNGLFAAWEFSGNADDVSGNGNDGVVNGCHADGGSVWQFGFSVLFRRTSIDDPALESRSWFDGIFLFGLGKPPLKLSPAQRTGQLA